MHHSIQPTRYTQQCVREETYFCMLHAPIDMFNKSMYYYKYILLLGIISPNGYLNPQSGIFSNWGLGICSLTLHVSFILED